MESSNVRFGSKADIPQGVDLKMDVSITGIERRIIDVTPVPEGKLIEVEAVELVAATPVKIPDESDC